MKDVFVLFIMTKNLHFNNCLTRINPFQYTVEILAKEMYKVIKGLFPKGYGNTFTPRNKPTYNLRLITRFKMSLVNSVYNGIESIALGPKIWELIPEEVKQKKSLNALKDAIKKCSPTNCPCRLCKKILHGVGFLQ